MEKKLDVVNYLRGFAIFTIVLMHLTQCYELSPVLKMAASFGGAGVHVFILCSGFGLYLSHLNHPLSYVGFLKKRFLKVYCPYVIAVSFYALWTFATSDVMPFGELASHIFLYKMFDHTLDVSICYPFWFISTIVQFYLFWPLIVWLAGRKQGVLAALMVSVAWWVVVFLLGYGEFRPWGSFFLQYLWEFVLGMKLAMWYHERKWTEDDLCRKVRTAYLLVAAVAGIALTGAMGVAGGGLKIFNDIPSLVGYTSLLLVVNRLKISEGG